MMKRVRRLIRIAGPLTGLSILSGLVVTAIVTLRHKLDTPQRLASALAGEEHIYRWKWGHIYYKALGAMDAPPFVLLHTPGIGASAYEMRSIIEPLAEYYRVYAPDLLGFGLSDRPQIDYTAETYITLCQDFLREVVARPATLLASRLSCNYAVAVAASTPELCERLVLITPTALIEGRREEGLATSRLEVRHTILPSNGWRGREALRRAPLRFAEDSYSPLHSIPLLPLRAVGQTALEVPVGRSLVYAVLSTRLAYRVLGGGRGRNAKADRDYFYATTHQFGAQYAPMALLAGKLSHNASQEFQNVQQPTLIIWGVHALNSAHSSTNKHYLSAHSKMMLLQDVGISLYEERPDRVVANILEWSAEGITRAPEVVKESVAPISEAETSLDKGPDIVAYCNKCKKKTLVQNPREVTTKNGRLAVQGICSVCGTNIFRLGKLASQGSKNT